MQLQSFKITGLFRRYDHTISFPLRAEGNQAPSLVLLCGQNGIGKTTILRMIDGFSRLDFTSFRQVPFKSATLTFSDKKSITVCPYTRKIGTETLKCLRVRSDGLSTDLHPDHSGALIQKEMPKTERFRKSFFKETADVTVQLVTTGRLNALYREHETREEQRLQITHFQEEPGEGRHYLAQSQPPQQNVLLFERIRDFMKDAQLNYRRFFSTGEPDLFPKILQRLTEGTTLEYESKGLIKRLQEVLKMDKLTTAHGLFHDQWNFNELRDVLSGTGSRAPSTHALTVANTYVEFLETRASERMLLVNRLRRFEDTANAFLKDKSVHVHAEGGLSITTEDGTKLAEARLSSGEYHLLYLLVVSLTAKRRGTVIAIDEPEISMHLEWQRKLVQGILQCASMAQPQLIIATHSPDITAGYPDACVDLNPHKK